MRIETVQLRLFSYAMIVVFAGTLVVTVIGSATVLLGL
jgi:hypothetical protein